MAADETGRHPATLSPVGAAFTHGGVSGGALVLGRTGNGYVSAGDVLPLTDTPFTISLWVHQPAGGAEANSALIGRYESPPHEGYFLFLHLTGFGTPHVMGSVVGFAGPGGLVVAGTALDHNAWHHIVMTRSAGGLVRLYVNGGPPVATASAGPVSHANAHLVLGGTGAQGQPVGAFTGWLDEVQIYDFDLTQEEVNELFRHPGESLFIPPPPPLQIVPAGGRFEEPVTVSLLTPLPLADLHYTMDGATPTVESPRYTGPWRLRADTVLQARAFTNGVPASEVVAAAFAFAMPPPPVGRLLARWAFDEPDGDLAIDGTGVHHGTLRPPGVWRSEGGVSGRALGLDGNVRGRVDLGQGLSLLDTDFTIAGWVLLPPHSPVVQGHLISKAAPGEPGGYAFSLGWSDGLQAVTATVGSRQAVARVPALGDGHWHFVAMTHSATAGLKVYVDGGAPRVIAASEPVGATPAPAVIGGGVSCHLDDLQVYDVALTESQIEILRAQPGVPLFPGWEVPLQIVPPGASAIGEVRVVLSAPHPGAQIRYTTDGSDPDADSTLYPGGLVLTRPTPLRARAFSGNMPVSDVVAAWFEVTPVPVPTGPLLARWTFDDGAGGSVRDETGRYDGTLSEAGVRWIDDGRVGGALALQAAAGGHVRLPGHLPSPDRTHSVSMWIRADGASVGTSHFLWRDGPQIVLNAGGYAVTVQNGTAAAAVVEPWLRDGAWHHVVMAYEPDGELRVLVDGGRCVGRTEGVPVPPSDAVSLVGAHVFQRPVGDFDGALDEMRLYDFALSDLQSQYLFDHPEAPLPETSAGPLRIRPEGGRHAEEVVFTMDAWDRRSRIHYTLDGSAPTEAAARYEGPVLLRQSAEIRARAFLGGEPVSPEVSASFVIDPIPEGTGRLLAHWRLDGGPDGIVPDSAGVHHGRLSDAGAGYIPDGVSGAALSLGRTGAGYVRFGDILPLLDQSWTIALWTRLPADGQASDAALFSRHNGGYGNGYFLSVQPDRGQMTAYSGDVAMVYAEGFPTDGAWHHVAMTYDLATETVRLYVDGGLFRARVLVGRIVPSTAEFLLGGYDNDILGIHGGLLGDLDDVQVYDFALAPGQIDRLRDRPGSALLEAAPEEVLILPGGGLFTDRTGPIHLIVPWSDADLHFTLDGTDPVLDSPRYTGPIELTATAELRVRAFRAGQPVTAVGSATFEVVPEPIPTGRLLAHWRFDEGSGLLAQNDAGTHPGRLVGSGVGWTPDGVDGHALDLDQGRGGRVMVGDVLGMADQPYTLSVWVRLEPGTTAQNLMIVSKHRPGSHRGHFLRLHANGHSVEAFSGALVLGAHTPVNDGAWHHLVVTHDAAGRVRIHIDGPEPVASGMAGPVLSTPAAMVLGGLDTDPPVGLFTGRMDDVQYYDFALSGDQIEFLRTHPGRTLDVPRAEPTPGLPVIEYFPRHAIFQIGHPIYLHVEAVGPEPLHYIWWFEDAPMPEVEGAVIAIAEARPEHAGNYRVDVVNAAGVVSSGNGLVEVLPRLPLSEIPRILEEPQDVTTPVGSTATFRVIAESRSEPILYEWFREGVPVSERGPDGATLVLNQVTFADAGTYYVAVANPVDGIFSEAAELRVASLNPPVFEPPPGVFEGMVAVGLTTEVPGASIHFTVDGSDPTPTSPIHRAPVPLTATTTLRARAFLDGHAVSPVGLAEYISVFAPPSPDGLIAHYPLEALPNGVVLDDLARHSGRASTQGVTLVPGGIAGGALQFESSLNGHVAFGDVLPMLDTPFSVALWVRVMPDTLTSGAVLFSKHRPGTGNGYFLAMDGARHAVSAHVGSGRVIAGGPGINDGTWHHVVLSVDPEGEARLFIDAVSVGSMAPAPPVLTSPAQVVLGGLDPGVPKGTFRGAIDDVQVYGRAVTSAEVALLFAHPGLPLASDLLSPLVFVPSSTTFTGEIQVQCVSPRPEAEVRYTTDGTEPTVESLLAAGPLTFTSRVTLRARAFAGGIPISPVVVGEYLLQPTPTHRGTLLAHWRLDSPGGLSAHDETGRWPGVLSASGATFVPEGVAGGSLFLSRSANGHVRLGEFLPPGDSPHSISLWFRLPPGDVTPFAGLLTRHRPGSHNGHFLALNYLGHTLAASAGPGSFAATRVPVNDGGWHHVVVVRETGGAVRLYVDGTPPRAVAPAGATEPTGALTLLGGHDPGVPTGTFTGYLDEVQVYDFALNDAEVDALFAHPDRSLDAIAASRLHLVPRGGIFRDTVTVRMATVLDNVRIHYTTDGTEPRIGSSIYTQPLVLTASGTLRARGFLDGQPVTAIETASFEIDRDAAAPASSLLAHWRFDELAGPGVEDTTGRHPGVLSPRGASFVPDGVAGGALSLRRADNGYVDLGRSLPLDSPGFTVAAWVRTPPGHASELAAILTRHRPGQPNGYGLFLNPVGIPDTAGRASALVGGMQITGITPVHDGGWHHVVLRSHQGGRMEILVDGRPAEAGDFAQTPVPSPARAVIGGFDAGAIVGTFEGDLDELQVYDIALTDAQVAFLYAHPGATAARDPASVQIVPPGGAYTAPVTVRLLANLPELSLRYTTDGLAPTASSPRYTGPLVLGASTVLRAAPFRDDVPAGEPIVATFVVEIPEPPVIRSQPTDVEVLIAYPFALAVEASGTAPLTFEWYRNDQLLPGHSGPVLAVPISLPSDSGTYRVRVSNVAGSALSQPAVVQVNLNTAPVPLGSVLLANRIVGLLDAPVLDVDGATPVSGSQFRADLLAGPTPDDLTPLGPAAPFLSGTDAGYVDTAPSAVRLVPGVEPGGIAYVRLRAWDLAAGHTWESANPQAGRMGQSEIVTVVAGGGTTPPAPLTSLTSFSLRSGLPPVIVTQPRSQSAPAGDTVRLTVAAMGEGLTYQWMFEGFPVPGAIQPTLELGPLRSRHAGRYLVAIRGHGGSSLSDAALLQVTAVRRLWLDAPEPRQEGAWTDVPLRWDIPNLIAQAGLRILYDPDHLGSPRLLFPNPAAQDAVSAVLDEPGRLRLMVDGRRLPDGSGHPVTLRFRCRSVPEPVATPVRLELLTLTDAPGASLELGTDLAGTEVRILPRSVVGDINANERVDVGDAAIMFRYVTLHDIPRRWDVAGNDLDGNGTLDSADPAIASFALFEGFPGPSPRPALASMPAHVQPPPLRLSLHPPRAAPGETTMARLHASPLLPDIAGVAFRIRYPAEALRILETLAPHARGFPALQSLGRWRFDSEPESGNPDGLLDFAVVSAQPWHADADALVAEIPFIVLPGATARALWRVELTAGEISPDGFELIPLPPQAATLESRPPEPPRLDGVELLPDGRWLLRVTGEAHRTYRLETSTDLLEWRRLDGGFPPGAWPFHPEPDRGNASPHRFFRLVAEP